MQPDAAQAIIELQERVTAIALTVKTLMRMVCKQEERVAKIAECLPNHGAYLEL